ncbi:odorant receptor 7a-like [Episyrphus balteatus]|uniref:odorant receptor 7a-like n=1 Tax=Episyrphus balteatus TaxID=286459 RepID=UPI0024854B54|nr:odorant receptor 7a-like [Episyrphus balteatus]
MCFFLFDIELIMKTLQISLYLCTVAVKQLMIYIGLSQFEMAKFYLSQLDKRASVNKDEFKYLKRIVKQCRYIGLTIHTIFVVSFVPYSVSNIVKKQLFFEGWLSSKSELSNMQFALAFSIQFFPILFQIIQNTANDAFSPVSINLLNGQIRVLGMRVARIGQDISKSADENYAELKACINDHRNIISLFDIIKPTVSRTVLVQLIITGALLCMTVFYYISFNHGSVSRLVATIFDMISILIVSLPICYFGNSLMEETEQLTTAIYNCNWTDQTLKFQKSLIIFMQRSQRENILTAGGLLTINLQTFIAIIRFSFSMFTVVSQMSEGIVSTN